MTLNGFGFPNYSGFLIGDADIVLKFKFFGKVKKKRSCIDSFLSNSVFAKTVVFSSNSYKSRSEEP